MRDYFSDDVVLFSTIVFFVFGAIIGSFLNVVIYRLHTGKTLGGSSHCLSCGKGLQWFELFPIVSYVVLRARCRGCGSFIPSRYFVVELLMGIFYGFLWYVFHADYISLILYMILGALLMVIAVYDVRHTVIPDELTVGVLAIALAFLVRESVVLASLGPVWLGLLGGAVASIFFGGLWYVSKGRWIGLGDAKLAFPLGLLVAYPGVFNMIIFSFWIGAAVSLGIIGVARLLKWGKTRMLFFGSLLTMKSEVPFAPFLVAGFLLVTFFHATIFDITYWIFGV